MSCAQCARLVSDYKRSVGFFTKAALRIPGVFGDDSMAQEVVDHLRQACKVARDALMEHMRQDHSNLSQEASSSVDNSVKNTLAP